MSESQAVSIRIFLPDGNPEGLRIVTRSGWSGCGLAFPRSRWADIKKRGEFDQPGVYVLLGPSENDSFEEKVYVGETESLKDRLTTHTKTLDYWTRAVFFTSTDEAVNKAHIRYIEASLIALLNESKRAEALNGNSGQRPKLSEADTADAEGFLAEVLRLLPLLQVDVFETPPVASTNSTILEIDWNQVKARGFVSDEGFVVLEGSTCRIEETPSLAKGVVALRSKLLRDGTLETADEVYRFTSSWVFSSPSQASDVCLGRSSSGLKEWTTADGLSLGALQRKIDEEA